MHPPFPVISSCNFNAEDVVEDSIVIALCLISYDLGTLTFLSHDRKFPLLRPALQQVLMPCFAELYTMPSVLRRINLG